VRTIGSVRRDAFGLTHRRGDAGERDEQAEVLAAGAAPGPTVPVKASVRSIDCVVRDAS